MSKLFGDARPIKPHLVPHRSQGGLNTEVAKLRSDVDAAFGRMEMEGGYLVTEEFTDPPVADPDAIVTTLPSSDQPRTLTGADLDGIVGSGEMVPPRNPTATATDHSDATTVACVYKGYLRVDGELVPHTVTANVVQDATTAATDVISIIESITIPAQGGAGANLTFGFGPLIGLQHKVRERAGLVKAIREISAGALVTNGVFTNGSKTGIYAANSAPDGSTDYAVTYEPG